MKRIQNANRNRLITQERIAKLPDEQLAWTLWEYIWLRVGKNYNELPQVLATLPAGFSVIYHLFVLDAEVNNGGFNQYFFNGTDLNAEQQSQALALIGALEHQRIFKKAFELHDNEKQDQKLQRLYAERTLESFSRTYKLTRLGKCDDEWYALDKELEGLMAKFIRANVKLFVEQDQNRKQ